MHRHFATVCSRITRFSPKCSEKITVCQSIQNYYQLFKYSLISSRNWIHVMSYVTLNTTPLMVEDPLLIKTLKTEKGWIVEKRLLSYQRDSGNDIMLLDLLRIIESTGFATRLSGSDQCLHIVLCPTDSNIKSINNLNLKQITNS